MKCAFCGLKATSPVPRTCWIHWVDVTFHGVKPPRESRAQTRLSAAPLIARVEQLQLRGMSNGDIAAMTGVTRREIVRLRNGHLKGLTPARADTWACRFRCHPSELWGDEWTAA